MADHDGEMLIKQEYAMHEAAKGKKVGVKA